MGIEMIRTSKVVQKPASQIQIDQETRIQVLSDALNRSRLAGQLGMSYHGDRDLYEVLGYKKDLLYMDYYNQYSRQDIAAAVINKPVDASWRGPVGIMESNDDQDTPLEMAWDELERRLHIKNQLQRLDKLTGIGRYGVLFLGLSDIKQTADLQKPIVPGKGLKLLYVRALSEMNAQINSYVTSPDNERYGLPFNYTVRIVQPGNNSSQTFLVHYSRIIHVADGLLEGSVFGKPRLKAVFNRLTDLEKLTGGSAEMFWRGARPGFHGDVNPDIQMSEDEKAELKDQFDEYDNNLRRFLVSSGITMQSLEAQVSDPSAHVDVQIQMISAETGIPKRILTGSERGELASSEDKDSWLGIVQGRREEWIEPNILHPFIERCIEYGILPAAGPDGYSITWSNLWAPSEDEKVKIGASRASAIQSYASNPYAMDIMPPEAFYKWCLGLSEEEVEEEPEEEEEVDE